MSENPIQVFISYARGASALEARALHAALPATSFLDQDDLQSGDPFPVRLAETLLDSRIVVVFADDAYFRSWYCDWELDAALGPYALALAAHRDPAPYLAHLVVVLPQGAETTPLDRFPPEIQAISWTLSGDTPAVAALVRCRLQEPVPALRDSYAALGQPMVAVRRRLLERSANRPPAPPARVPRVFPWRVPPSLGDRFVGRARDLWQVDHALSTAGSAPTVVIEGAGGVGKTRLALEYFHRLGPRRFPGGVFWIDAEEDLESQHHGILQALNPTAPGLPAFQRKRGEIASELTLAVRRAAATAPMLFIIDDVPEAPSGITPSPLSRWCPAIGNVAVLVTCRTRLSPGERTTAITLDGLDRGAAAQLLTPGIESATSDAVADWVGGLPLALTLLGAAIELGSLPVSELARLAASSEGQTAALDAQMDAIRPHVPPGSLRGVTEALSASYQRLAPDAQHAAALLAVLAPSPIPMELVQELEIGPATRATLVARSFVGRMVAGGSGDPTELFGSMHRVLGDFLRSVAPLRAADWAKVYRSVAAVVDRAVRTRRWHTLLACAPHVLRTLYRGAAEIQDETRDALARTLKFSMTQLAQREHHSSELPSYLASLSWGPEFQASSDQIHELARRYAQTLEALVGRAEKLQRARHAAPAAILDLAHSMLEAAIAAGGTLGDRPGKLVTALLEATGRLRASLNLPDVDLLISTAVDVVEAATAVQGTLVYLAETTMRGLAAATEFAVATEQLIWVRFLQAQEENPSVAFAPLMKRGLEKDWIHAAYHARAMSTLLVDLGRHEEALASIRIAIDVLSHLEAMQPGSSEERFLVECREALRRILRDLGRPEDGDPGGI